MERDRSITYPIVSILQVPHIHCIIVCRLLPYCCCNFAEHKRGTENLQFLICSRPISGPYRFYPSIGIILPSRKIIARIHLSFSQFRYPAKNYSMKFAICSIRILFASIGNQLFPFLRIYSRCCHFASSSACALNCMGVNRRPSTVCSLSVGVNPRCR